MPSQELVMNDDLNEVSNQPTVPAVQGGNERLTIRIPTFPKQTIETTLNTDTPDYPTGTT